MFAERNTQIRKKKKGKEKEIYVILFTPNMLLSEMRFFVVLTLCRIIIFLTFRRKVLTPSSQHILGSAVADRLRVCSLSIM